MPKYLSAQFLLHLMSLAHYQGCTDSEARVWRFKVSAVLFWGVSSDKWAFLCGSGHSVWIHRCMRDGRMVPGFSHPNPKNVDIRLTRVHGVCNLVTWPVYFHPVTTGIDSSNPDNPDEELILYIVAWVYQYTVYQKYSILHVTYRIRVY